MRKENKYKIYKVSGICLKKFPLRILKFRRPKWNVLQKLLKGSLVNQRYSKQNKQSFFGKRKVKISLINSFLIKKDLKRWGKVKNYYKTGFKYKNVLQNIFDRSIKYSFFKKKSRNLSLKKDFILNYLVYPIFRLDILLWNLNFFSSSFQARQVINNNGILLNGKRIKANVFLTKGDIITFKDTKNEIYTYNQIVERFSKTKKFLTFVEIDYYTKTIVVLKDYKELSLEDLYLLITEYLDLKNFSYNL
jgi:ribosomal protein S4